MPGTHIRFTFNEQTFRQMQDTGMIAQSVERAAGKVRDDAKRIITTAGRVDTGRMRNSIQTKRLWSAGRTGVIYEVGTDLNYAIFQHEGTRDHGPRRASMLRFKPKGSGTYVFAARVRGVKALHFLTDALRNLKASDFGI